MLIFATNLEALKIDMEPFVTLCLDGPPRAKGRPRTRVIGKFATIYTDSETRKYENSLKAEGIKAMGDREPTAEAVSVAVHARLPIPPSWSAKKRSAALSGDLAPISGIDLDNIVKCLDGLNYHPPRFKGDKLKRPIIWHNDSQIVSMQAIKSYSAHPRLEITVWRWND